MAIVSLTMLPLRGPPAPPAAAGAQLRQMVVQAQYWVEGAIEMADLPQVE
jgi:hypothetical protein